jgi:lipid-binding SYLF domain-containing protein
MRQVLCVAATLFASAVITSAAVTKTELKRIEEAATVLHEIHQAPDKDLPEDLWERASCVAVIPSVKKAAFIVGGEYGKGVMSCRNGSGWSAPSFIVLEKGSFGIQIGGETVDLVLLVMNDHGVNHLLQDKVALGGEASIAGGPVGRDTRAMTDAQLKAEILSYSRSQGLFAGLDLSGGVLKPDRDANRDLYDREIAPRDILITKRVGAPRSAAPFMAALRRTVRPKVAAQH